MLSFFEIVQTILLLLITAVTTYIAYHLFRTNKDKSNYGLFESRLVIYREVIRMISLVTRDGDISSDELLSFRAKTYESNFLFDKDLADYIDELYSRGMKLRTTNDLLKSPALPIGEKRDDVTVQNSKQLIWLADQLPMVKKRFIKYLQIPDVNSQT